MVTSISQMIEAKCAGDNVPRQYLGLSEIGHHCPRWLWYAHHGVPAKPVEGRIIRLFRLGNMVETGIIADLNAIGLTVTNQQEEVEITDRGVTLKGHIDGELKKNLLEIKSANDKSFNQLVKLGSYERWNPKYKAQAHVYMVLKNMNKCLVIVENKNDSSLYTETLTLDRDYVTKLLIDVFNAILSPEPPERTCPDASWFQAKICSRCHVCF